MITLFCIHPKGFNIGNDAIHYALRDLVHRAFGRVVNIISIPATSAYESHSRAGLTAKTIHEINRFGDGVIVGGGNLYENNELLVSADALTALEPPLMLFSLSKGRIYNRNLELVDRTDAMPDRTMQALHKVAALSLARDGQTLAHLHRIGCNNAILGGCPTIFLGRADRNLPALPEGEYPGVLISIRNPNLMNIPLRQQSKVQGDIEAMIDTLREAGHRRIRLLCNDIRDVEYASIFQGTRAVDFIYTSDVTWYLALLKSAELLVSYRLHATLPAISYGTPTVSVSYDERAMSLLEALGLSEWDIDMVRSSSVIGDVRNRLGRLEDLAALRARCMPDWDRLGDVQLRAMSEFADKVKAYVRNVPKPA
jgi:polysaccharide pyruvyl transferase WcaK-like protein